MSEKLIIKNFGPIKHVELELKKFNILIGEQATGKSTVAKLLIAILNNAHREIFDIEKYNEKLDNTTNQFLGHLQLSGIRTYLKNSSYIYYNDNKSIEFEYQLNHVSKKLNHINFEESIKHNITYIPSERILVSTLSNSLFALLEIENSNLPKLLLRFGNKFQSSKIKKEEFNYKNFIGVNYKYNNGLDIIVLESGEEILMHNASNGMQSVVSLLTVFDDVTNNNNNLVVIEEPELNCFPITQQKLIEHFAERKNISIFNLLLTTHSPYILTSLNNLMYAYQVGQTNKEQVNKIIPEKYWVNPEEVSAYQLLKDGTCIDILDKEEKLIEAERIDEVSRTINKEFDDLMNIEIKDEK